MNGIRFFTFGVTFGVAALAAHLTWADQPVSGGVVLRGDYSVQVQCSYTGQVPTGGDQVKCGGINYVVDLGQLKLEQVTALDGSQIQDRKSISGDILIDATKVPFNDQSGQLRSPCSWEEAPNVPFMLPFAVPVKKSDSCSRPDGTNTASYSGPSLVCGGQVSCVDNEPSHGFKYTIGCAPSVTGPLPKDIRCPTVEQCLTDTLYKVTKPAGTKGRVMLQNKDGGDGVCFEPDGSSINAPGGNCIEDRNIWDKDKCVVSILVPIQTYSATSIDRAGAPVTQEVSPGK